jgi:hypothetical protein
MPKLGCYSNITGTVFNFPDMKINVRLYLFISIQTYCATSTVLTNSEILRELTPKYYVILCQFRPKPIIEKQCI